MTGILIEVNLVVETSGEVFVYLQIFGSLVKVSQYEIVWFLQTGSLLWLIAVIVLCEYNAKFLRSLLIAIVSLAETLDQLWISQCTCEVSLALILLQLVELLIPVGVCLHLIYVVEQEVGSVDNTIKIGIYRLDVGVGSLDIFPTVDIAIGIRVALHAVHEVCLQIWQDSQIARIESAALETVVDTVHQLVHVAHRVDSLVHADRILRILIKTGRHREG